MMKRIAAFDEKTINVVQDGYLWLFDRTGAYVATCCVTCLLIGQAIERIGNNGSMLGLILTGVISFSFSPSYLLQMSGRKAMMNALARTWRSSKIRYVYMLAMFIIATVPKWSICDALDCILCVLAISYGQSIQIRDREPKEFFPSRKLALGTA